MAGQPIARRRKALEDERMSKPFFWDDMFTRVSHGLSLVEYARTREVSYKRMMARIKADGELAQRLEEAKHARAWGYFEDVDRLTMMVQEGKIEPNAGRVVLQSRQWQAKMMDQGAFGDKQQVEMKVQDVTQAHLEAVRRMAAPQVLEGELVEDSDDKDKR